MADQPHAAQLRRVRRALVAATPGLRRDLPWVGHGDPWGVVVSEFMLQQTQTARVVGPWTRFMAQFPTPQSCAAVSLADVLRAWAGLGFPRRAKYLHETAKAIVERHGGIVPRSRSDLRALPGVGPYTTNAIATFAFDERCGVLDTNVGRVVARCVANATLPSKVAQELCDALIPTTSPGAFNQALLDVGAQFCSSTPRCLDCPLRKVCAWRAHGGEDPAPLSAGVSKPQARFAGSLRQTRGGVMAQLQEGPMTITTLRRNVTASEEQLDRALEGLLRDGLITRRGQRYRLGSDAR